MDARQRVIHEPGREGGGLGLRNVARRGWGWVRRATPTTADPVPAVAKKFGPG
jgi:hypothetical protein